MSDARKLRPTREFAFANFLWELKMLLWICGGFVLVCGVCIGGDVLFVVEAGLLGSERNAVLAYLWHAWDLPTMMLVIVAGFGLVVGVVRHTVVRQARRTLGYVPKRWW